MKKAVLQRLSVHRHPLGRDGQRRQHGIQSSRLGYGVWLLPSPHPVRVAERVALLDQLTDGRIELGTGRSNA